MLRSFRRIRAAVEEKIMKRLFGVILACTLFAVPALAAKNSQTVTIPTAVQVGSTVLPAGDYKVSWTGSGDSAQVTIAKKGVAPVTVPAKVVEQKNNHNGVSTGTQDGKAVLQTVLLPDVKLVL
jgi:curli biogenesis system outer membrane secretion channel CsgG